MSGHERDLFGRLGNGFLPKGVKQNYYLEERKIEEACRHEAATAIATPEEEVLQIALSHYREALSVGCVRVGWWWGWQAAAGEQLITAGATTRQNLLLSYD